MQPGKAGHEGGAVSFLELVEARPVDDARDDLADVVRVAAVGADDAGDLRRVVAGILRRGHVRRQALGGVECRDHRPAHFQRLVVVFREIVGDSGDPRVDVRAPEIFGRHFLSGRRFDERRPAEKDRARTPDDDGLVRHGRDVGAARRARSHDGGNLRDPLRRHPRLVEEDASEMVAIGKHLGLQRQERAAGVDEVHAGQTVLQRDVLRAHVLLDGDREVRPALHRRVVGDDDHFAAGDAADAGDESGPGRIAVVHVERRERRELQKRRTGIEQPIDPVADRQLALLAMPFDVLRAAALAGGEQTLLQLGDEPQHAVTVALKGRVAGIDVRVEDYHPQQSVSSPRAGQRQRACIRYISKAGDTGSDMSKIIAHD